MDIGSVILIFNLVKDILPDAVEIHQLMERAKNGETVTDEEIVAARAELDQVITDWKNA